MTEVKILTGLILLNRKNFFFLFGEFVNLSKITLTSICVILKTIASIHVTSFHDVCVLGRDWLRHC